MPSIDYTAGEPLPFSSQTIAAVNVSAGADQAIITGVSGQRIVVLYGTLATAAASSTLLVESGTTTALTGVIPIPANTIWPIDPTDRVVVWKCVAGQNLTFTVTGGDIDGWLVYTMVQAQ